MPLTPRKSCCPTSRSPGRFWRGLARCTASFRSCAGRLFRSRITRFSILVFLLCVNIANGLRGIRSGSLRYKRVDWLYIGGGPFPWARAIYFFGIRAETASGAPVFRTDLAHARVASRDDWLAERKKLPAEEKELDIAITSTAGDTAPRSPGTAFLHLGPEKQPAAVSPLVNERKAPRGGSARSALCPRRDVPVSALDGAPFRRTLLARRALRGRV